MSASNFKDVHQGGAFVKRLNQVSALLWIAVGAVVVTQTRGLKYMAEYGPGPGFLPFWLGIGVIILGILLLAKVTFSFKEREDLSVPNKHAAWQMFLVMFGFFGFVFLADKVGFLFCIGLLFVFLLVMVERKGWMFSLIIAIVNTLFFWTIFELGLHLRLPTGLLGLFQR